MESFGVSEASDHALEAVLQGVVEVGVGGHFSSPAPITHAGREIAILMLHICFYCVVLVDVDLTPM